MDEKSFNKLIKNNLYQVFIFTSPLPFPLNFSVHSWVVTSNKGKVKRWEILHHKNLRGQKTDYLYLNLLKPSQRMNSIFRKNFCIKEEWNSKIVGYIEGKEGSTAEKFVKFMEKNALKYKMKHVYRLISGPNCHRFTNWAIGNFPESNLKLPWKAIDLGVYRN